MWFKVIWFLDHCGNIAIIHWVKNTFKTKRYALSLWDTNPWSIFCDPYWELICRNKWHPRTSEISTPLEMAVGTHFHVRYGTKPIPVMVHQKTPIRVSSGWQVRSEKVRSGQVWESLFILLKFPKTRCLCLFQPSLFSFYQMLQPLLRLLGSFTHLFNWDPRVRFFKIITVKIF